MIVLIDMIVFQCLCGSVSYHKSINLSFFNKKGCVELNEHAFHSRNCCMMKKPTLRI